MQLHSIVSSIDDILQDSAFTELRIVDRINTALQTITAGVRMPDNSMSPSIPDLYTLGSVTTSTTLAYTTLPTDYQRRLTSVVDSSGLIIPAPRGGDYYSFVKFVDQASDKLLAESGSIYVVAVRGRKIYYQGIPTVATTLSLHYYAKPDTLVADTDEPDCLPEHLQERLLKHWVLKEFFGEAIEDGQDNKGIAVTYHTGKFFEAMTDLAGYVGIDSSPMYYGSDSLVDAGVCDV